MLGSMPTDHVVTMLRASPPQRAAGALLAMPKDRIDRLLAVMDGRMIARMLIATDPARRLALLGHLDDTRLAAELALLPVVEAAAVLAVLPIERARPQLERGAPEHAAMLLDAMPAAQRTRLVAVLDPLRDAELRRVAYEKAVIDALRGTAATLQWVPDDHGSNLLAGVFHRLFGVALRHVADGPLPAVAVADAHRVFAQRQVHGVLIVTNAFTTEVPVPSREPPALVVVWESGDNDGVLGRALVRLAG
ncbi:hypothetical protein Ahu01nite_029770 [Winogradskya humida]|uniref:MgtE-like protein n=1 Tax=Winogradskya humida TaxID=113566 RepID=A0ABQ3ZMR0_9ACTN|nr:hypothetical protein Ahu01nite_029770 [Actinoplanes humidus]